MIFVAFGGNLKGPFGSPVHNFKAALSFLDEMGIKFIKLSNIYRTTPEVGNQTQSDYYNAVVELNTSLDPNELLGVLTKVESSFGRTRKHKNDPRVLDLDLLLYYDNLLTDKNCQVPHPRMWERNFVLKPLSDLKKKVFYPNEKGYFSLEKFSHENQLPKGIKSIVKKGIW